MTLEELQGKRDEVLRSVEIARLQFGDRSVEYRRQEEALATIDREIAKLTQQNEPRVFVLPVSRGL